MSLVQLLIALALCLVSLVTATACLTISPKDGVPPALIAWVTVSAAAFYVFLCMPVVTYLRTSIQPIENAKLRPKSGFSIETDSNAGEPPERSANTFHWESDSFRMTEGLDQQAAPRSPETVLHYPLRSSYLRLPALTFSSLLSPKTLPPSPTLDLALAPIPSTSSLPPTQPLHLTLPPIPSPVPSPSQAEIRKASPVIVLAVGKASEVRISPPSKGKAKMVRTDSARKVRETTRKMVEDLGLRMEP